jgi:putative ABC transport system permease protein
MMKDATPRSSSLTAFGLAMRSLRYHARMNAAVALGVVAGTAVLTGALLVGDSVRGSLRSLTLDRLGRIEEALVVDHFFRVELADELSENLAAAPDLKNVYGAVVPAILLTGNVTQPDSGSMASKVTLIGCNENFWALDGLGCGEPMFELKADEIFLNEPLAEQLGVKSGQEVVVHFPRPSEIPRDSALGRKTETTSSVRLRVSYIMPATGLGRFGLRPNQALPLNAYLNLDALQAALKQDGKVNALFISGGAKGSPDDVDSEAQQKQLQAALHPRLIDFGLSVQLTKQGAFNLTSERMLLDPVAERSAMKAFADDHPQPVLTYLANTIAAGNREIPYSTIAAIDFTDRPPLGPFRTPQGEAIAPLADDEIVLNRWAADDLQVEPGDMIEIKYFEPESTHGNVIETTKSLRLKAIAALEGPAADPDLTPTLAGVTDQLSIADWNPPFPFDSNRVRDADEKYWDDHQATPKAFVSLSTGRKFWTSRFGNTTSIRLPPAAGLSVETIRERWRPDPLAMNFEFRPLKRQGLAASAGTQPFNLLFLGFSFFIIAAAVMLVGLLFRLGIERRAREIGIELALGLGMKRVRRMLLFEGFVVAVIGGLLGVVAGLGYAWLMLAGLRSWWLAAVSTPFLQMYVTPASLVVGGVSGVLVSLAAIAWTLWAMRRASVRRLLAGQVRETGSLVRRRPRVSRVVAWSSALLAAVLTIVAMRLSGEAQAGAFFGAGACVLTAALAFVWIRLATGETGPLITTGGAALVRLALRNAARSPGRSTLTMGLVAAASFLIVAISAFHLVPPERFQQRDSGTGGFALVAESDQPIYQDLNSEDGRADLGFSSADDRQLAGTKIFPIRVQAGDDASCLNLYQPQQPRVLGVSTALIDRGGFAWAGSAATTPDEKADPWKSLDKVLPSSVFPSSEGSAPVVPVVVDQATAIYSLHLSGKPGDHYEMTDGRGGKLTLEVVGVLQNSLFQGSLLMSEKNLLRHFPGVSGYRFFLVDAPADKAKTVETALERTLGDYGFDTQLATSRLAEFMAVQNTYLSTFQSLGGLGLLLGTFGLATVQLRNILERRGELALLRATGFRRSMLARLVMWENATLLVGGLAIGTLAALVAVVPHLGGGQAAIPWLSLAGTLGAVLIVGLSAGLLVVRSVLTTPLLPALRAE